MKIAHPPLFLLLLAAGACASAGTPGDAESALAYRVPEGGAVTYLQADTTTVSIDAGGQTVDIDQWSRATLDLVFASGAEGVQVTATWSELDAAASNPMAGTQRATAADIDGPVVFTLSPTGRTTIVEEPSVSRNAAQLVDIDSWAATFFPRLPAAAVSPGFTWTDTVDARSERSEGVIAIRSIVSYTVQGDTTVAGNTLLAVTFTSQDERSAQVTEQGMDVSQALSGTGQGRFLWDRARGRLHSKTESGMYSGTMEVSAAPFPLAVAVEARSHLGLAEGG